MPNQGNTYSPIQYETDDTIYKNFLEVAQILNDYVDIFYLDVLCSIKEIQLALEATKNFNKKVMGIFIISFCFADQMEDAIGIR